MKPESAGVVGARSIRILTAVRKSLPIQHVQKVLKKVNNYNRTEHLMQDGMNAKVKISQAIVPESQLTTTSKVFLRKKMRRSVSRQSAMNTTGIDERLEKLNINSLAKYTLDYV